MRKLIIRLYSSAANARGRSPLDLPERAVWITLLLALAISSLVGNLFVRGLYARSESVLLNERKITLSEKNTNHESRVAELTKLKVPANSLPSNLNLGDLFTGNVIEYQVFERWLEKRRQVSPEQIRTAVMGRLEGGLFPVTRAESISNVLKSFQFEKPNPNELRSVKADDWDYYITAACLDQYRKGITSSYGNPLRLAFALADWIQWLTFFLAVWGGLMLWARFVFTRIQRRLVLTGKNPTDQKDGSNIWKIEQSDPESLPLYARLQDAFPSLFLAADLISQCMHAGVLQQSPHAMQEFINEKIAEAKAKVESSEFELIDFVVFACPTLGFLGTIVGITAAFAQAAAIISSTNTIDRTEAFDNVTQALAVAFDTSFVGLLAVLVLNMMLSLLKRREASLFNQLGKEAFAQLRRIQRIHQKNNRYA